MARSERDNTWDGRYSRIKNIQDPKEDQDVLTLHWAKENKESLLKALTETSEEQQKAINNLCDTQKQNLTGQYQTYKENIENIKTNIEQLYENIKTTSKTEKETIINTGDIKKSEIEQAGNTWKTQLGADYTTYKSEIESLKQQTEQYKNLTKTYHDTTQSNTTKVTSIKNTIEKEMEKAAQYAKESEQNKNTSETYKNQVTKEKEEMQTLYENTKSKEKEIQSTADSKINEINSVKNTTIETIETEKQGTLQVINTAKEDATKIKDYLMKAIFSKTAIPDEGYKPETALIDGRYPYNESAYMMWDAIKNNKDTVQEYVEDAKRYANEAKENSGAKNIEEKLQNKFYTKEEINQKLKELPSQKVTDVYSKKEVDDKLEKKENKLPEDFLDSIFRNIEPLINKDHYQKDECNEKFQPKGNYAALSYEGVGGGFSGACFDTSLNFFVFKKPILNYYSQDEVDKKFQPKGNYALKSDIPKAQDLTPYAKKTDLINKIEKKDIYQENFIKLPDGTLIGIETKSGGVNNTPTPPEKYKPNNKLVEIVPPSSPPQPPIDTKDLEDEIGKEPSIKP